MSRTMTALHPSNPYYKALKAQSSTAAEPQSLPSTSPNLPPTQSMLSTDPTTSALPSSQLEGPSNPTERQRAASVDYRDYQKPRSIVTYRTRSIGGPFGCVYFERQVDTSPPNDDEIIIVGLLRR
jgi:hypothetical protein